MPTMPREVAYTRPQNPRGVHMVARWQRPTRRPDTALIFNFYAYSSGPPKSLMESMYAPSRAEGHLILVAGRPQTEVACVGLQVGDLRANTGGCKQSWTV